MKLLYIAFKDFSKLHFGASKKVISECKSFSNKGYDVTLIGRVGYSTAEISIDEKHKTINIHRPFLISKLQPLFDKINEINDIISYVKDKKFDICYIRFDLCDYWFVKLLKKLKIVSSKILIEIPTYPYEEEYTGTINKIRLKIDDFYAKKIKRYVDKIITFYDIPRNQYYGVSCLLVPNGFDFDNISIIKDDEVISDIHIAAVSSMRLWHGYERMIEGMGIYYQRGGKRNIFLHIVGDGREGDKYKQVTQNFGLEKNVIFHGAMHGEEMDVLLDKCSLGLDSLGRHRTGISMLSSLKSREYGAKGIPFINSCDIDIVDDDFKYFLKVPADESPIDIESVISFYDDVYKEKSRILVAKEVRKYIEERSNMDAVVEKILYGVGDIC